MKIIKKIGIVIAVFVAIYIIMALMGPSSYKVTRTIKIATTTKVVYNQTANYSSWAAWSPWAKMDPEAKYTIAKDGEVGGSLSWDGTVTGKGSMTTQELIENEKFIYELNFIEPWYMAMTSNGGFIYEQDGDSTLVTWYDEGDFGFMSRGMMLLMSLEDQIGPQFEQGLAEIKEICEAIPSVSKVEITEIELEAQAMFYIEESSKLDTEAIGEKIGAAYGEIGALMGANELEPVGMPLNITTEFSLAEMNWVFDCAIRVESTEEIELTGRVKAGMTYAGKVVKGVHIGPYENMVITYNIVKKYLAAKGLEQNGRTWEEYIDDPSAVSPEEVRTFVYFPVK